MALHAAGKLGEARIEYENHLRENGINTVCAQNLLAILRAQKDYKAAEECYHRAVKAKVATPGVKNNYANVLRDQDKIIESIGLLRDALKEEPEFVDAKASLLAGLKNLGYKEMATLMCYKYIKEGAVEKKEVQLLLAMLGILLEDFNEQREPLISDILINLKPLVGSIKEKVKQINICCGIALGFLRCKRYSEANEWNSEAHRLVEAIQTSGGVDRQIEAGWHNYCWNYALFCLNCGLFEKGWKMYDHGLRVPAAGPQKWQRALPKYFTSSQLEVYRGGKKRVLILGEQGIGDTMMFATLLSGARKSFEHIYFAPGDRLSSIYERSLGKITGITLVDDKKLKYESNEILSQIDAQLPIEASKFVNEDPLKWRELFGDQLLKADAENTKMLREKYVSMSGKNKLVGISWTGGGVKKRIKMKSVSLDYLLPILTLDDYGFVSLQYGNDEPMIKRLNKLKGTSLISDSSVNPFNDMDLWLSQVDACDYVISIANTTIHGAGGLGKPTACLLSKHYDWRWTHQEIYDKSYWYSSVDVFRQASDGDWKKAIQDTVEWLQRL